MTFKELSKTISSNTPQQQTKFFEDIMKNDVSTKKTALKTFTIIIMPTTIVALIALLNGFNDWNALVYAVPQGLNRQTLQVPNEQTINDVRASRLVLLEGIDNAIQRLIESQTKTSIQNPTEGFDTTH